ncbi:inositol monophosphatase family protein [Halomonas sp. PAMB 3264]|uniref:inositol monophosphatase family protein n=1 Tax=Halomonas sp. PAMB 3264 TaxID=3075222 RepID=UPI00289A4091|nr:inositol monophosphatase family protein [Halomonas sp. PAMB 3264]WNL43889.1 inositol monophosphatase family protein [Halomonas sp. PAMB 3264]
MAVTLKARLEETVRIAEEAGRMIVKAREEQCFDQRLKEGIELVTDVDVAVDTFISQQLDKHFPGELQLSEELSPEQGLSTKSPLWVVDPIDGTVNFAQGLRHVAVSIAWLEAGAGKVGVVHAPFLDETFTACEGGGAFCNGQPIKPSSATELPATLVGTGFPYDRAARKALMPRLETILTHCQDIRRNGAAALDICDIACGRLDAYVETVSPWDFAAGWVIAREAGATVGRLVEVPEGVSIDLYPKELLITAPGVFQSMKSLLLDAI